MLPRKYPPIIYGLKRKLREGIELANEEFFYQDLVLPIEAQLVDFIFDARGGEKRHAEFDFRWPYPVDPEEFDSYSSDYFVIDLSVYPEDDMSAPTNVAGNAGETDLIANIEIRIEYERGVDINDHYNAIVSELRGTLAHEIHHLTQEGPLKRPDCPFLPERESDSYRDYFISACEVPAFVIGFRAESNHSGVPVAELITYYLDNYKKVGAISDDEAREVYEKWTGHSFA